MSVITTERHDDVLVIISNNPPVNALGAAVRQGLVDGIDEALGENSVKAVVIRCDGRTFFILQSWSRLRPCGRTASC